MFCSFPKAVISLAVCLALFLGGCGFDRFDSPFKSFDLVMVPAQSSYVNAGDLVIVERDGFGSLIRIDVVCRLPVSVDETQAASFSSMQSSSVEGEMVAKLTEQKKLQLKAYDLATLNVAFADVSILHLRRETYLPYLKNLSRDCRSALSSLDLSKVELRFVTEAGKVGDARWTWTHKSGVKASTAVELDKKICLSLGLNYDSSGSGSVKGQDMVWAIKSIRVTPELLSK
jgi:hypothetical protein